MFDTVDRVDLGPRLKRQCSDAMICTKTAENRRHALHFSFLIGSKKFQDLRDRLVNCPENRHLTEQLAQRMIDFSFSRSS